MIRKVLTIGQSSYAVTLPPDFIREHGLQPGEQLTVSHQGSMLTVRAAGTQTHVQLDLKGMTPKKLRATMEFSRHLLSGFFMAGAQKVTLQHIPAELRAAVKKELRENNLQFYECDETDTEIHITCPVTLSEPEALVRRAMQLLYTCFEEEDRNVAHLRERLQLARRAVSQNLNARHHLALYTIIEMLDLMAYTLQDIQGTPEYFAEYAQATYLLHQAFTAETLIPLCPLVEHLKAMVEDLKPDDQTAAKQLLTYMERACANTITYRLP